MKIIHIIGYFQPEMGYEEFYLAKQQVKDGHDVYVLTSDRIWPFSHLSKLERKRLIGVDRIEGFTLIRHKSLIEFRDLIIFKGLLKNLYRIKPDVIHVHEPRQGLYGPLAIFYSRKIQCKVIVDVHEYKIRKWWNYLEYILLRYSSIKYCLFNSNAVIAITPKTQHFLRKIFKFNSSILLSLGADHETFYFSYEDRFKIRKDLNIQDSDIAIIFSGKISPSKGLEIILNQLSILVSQYKIKLLIVGSGAPDYIKKLKNSIEKMELNQYVIFVNEVCPTELYKYFSAADVAYWPISPTISILEALACGLPVLAGNSDITGHVINDSVGMVIEKNDNSIDSIKKLIHLYQLGTFNRKKISDYFMSNFSYKTIAKKIENIYLA